MAATYRHPQGKVVVVEDDGTLTCTKNGKRATTSATAEKLAAGYGGWQLVESTDSPIPAMPANPPTGMAVRRPMKFKQADPADLARYVSDPRYWMQQKVDGIRAQLVMGPDGATVRSGGGGPLKSTTAGPVAARVLTAVNAQYEPHEPGEPTYCLDGEIVGREWWLFDLVPDQPRTDVPLHKRLAALNLFVRASRGRGLPDAVRLLPTATTEDEKMRLLEKVVASGAEGVIIKRRDSGYAFDDRVDHSLNFKVTHTVDAVVIARDTKVDCNATLALYPPDSQGSTDVVEVGNCSMIGKPDAQVGQVVEVKYLYAGSGGRLVQPSVIRIRDDKEPRECTTDQLVFVNKAVLA